MVPQHRADDAAEDVDNADVWVDEDADEDVGEVEDMADHSHDDPGNHEAGIPLKYKYTQACLGLLEYKLCKRIFTMSKLTVLVPWIRQAQITVLNIEISRKITPKVKIPEHGG